MSSSTEQKPAGSACGYSDFLDIMRALPLFSRVPLDVCKVLAYLSTAETFQAGDVLVRQGEHAEAFYYLTCGRASVSWKDGETEVELKTLREGDSLGGLALILGAGSLFTVRADEETVAMTLTREKFQKTVQRFPQVEPALLQALAEHVLGWEERFLSRHPQEFASLGQDFGLTLF
ncbi:Crp/Fnr family transcriptional regulator [Fundidesulfovibrio terrae]|uniref:Crp/Fnr family transcriptional regulator n=1 Tax=Fundidesulfovibrio terrae TaxID=2922866 RepID=UPI001FAFB7E0|nr:cyclic nucleotide-binding domain-containing protein [Fundidesulfovibrio terrae]